MAQCVFQNTFLGFLTQCPWQPYNINVIITTIWMEKRRLLYRSSDLPISKKLKISRAKMKTLVPLPYEA